ncbi:MAG: MaoC family dehydratase [Actinomycetota bacterium]
MTTDFPKSLTPVTGPFLPVKIQGAAAGMGTYGDATRRLVGASVLQPDLICGMTLALLARQPRKPKPSGEKKASGVAGRVWVRERFTVHRPIPNDDPWTVTGETTGTYVRKGRSYSTTSSVSHTSEGELFATNLTTGLFSYRPDPTLEDSVEGLAIDDTPAPEPDPWAAMNNPCAAVIAGAAVGDTFGGVEVPMTLAMMAARDTDNPDNPIHSDPEQARKAGLARPIAGGSHVLSFALEAVMAAWGDQALLHGTTYDIRWKAPTQDDTVIIPIAEVTAVERNRIEVNLRVDLLDGPTAMVGRLVVPLAIEPG